MSKHILLAVLLITTSMYAKKQSLYSSTDSWCKRFGVHQFSSSDKQALASGLYYLLKEKGDDQRSYSAIDQFYTLSQSGFCHYNCRNALLSACEKSVLASHKEQNMNTAVWAKTLLPYYAEVIGMLNEKDLTVNFGKDQGKKLPSTLFELDRALNPRTHFIVTFFSIQTPQLSMHLNIST